MCMISVLTEMISEDCWCEIQFGFVLCFFVAFQSFDRSIDRFTWSYVSPSTLYQRQLFSLYLQTKNLERGGNAILSPYVSNETLPFFCFLFSARLFSSSKDWLSSRFRTTLDSWPIETSNYCQNDVVGTIGDVWYLAAAAAAVVACLVAFWRLTQQNPTTKDPNSLTSCLVLLYSRLDWSTARSLCLLSSEEASQSARKRKNGFFVE